MTTSKLTSLYIFALSSVAFLTLLGQGIVQFTLSSQDDDSRIINIAGRQRMLSQKLTKEVLKITILHKNILSSNSIQADTSTLRLQRQQKLLRQYHEHLQGTLDLWTQSHEGLRYGTQLDLPGGNSTIVDSMYTSMEANFQSMAGNVGKVLEYSTNGFTVQIDSLQVWTDSILVQEEQFLPKMNEIVFQYDKESRSRVEMLKYTEILLLLVTLTVLLIEGLYVFRPAVRALKDSISTINDKNISLEEQAVKISKQNSQLSDTNKKLEEINEEFSHLNEELAQTNSDILIQKQLLEEQAVEIEVSNTKLQESNETLKALDKEKNEFIGIATHDLKNPLTSIQLNSQLIGKKVRKICEEQEPTDSTKTTEKVLTQVDELSERIHDSASRMFLIITNLLDVNRIEQNNIEINIGAFPMENIVQSMLDHYRPQARAKGITLHYSTENPHHSQCIADSEWVNQIMDNLLSNAIKYSPYEKDVFVKISTQSESGNSFITVSVRDEGQGLTEEDKSKLFGKFTRLSAQPTGGEHSTGLGLSIVKKLTELMDGTIWAESDGKDKGSTFFLQFPAEQTDNSTVEVFDVQSVVVSETAFENKDIIKQTLRDDFVPSVQNLQNGLVLGDIQIFAEKVSSFGLQYDLDSITTLGSVLSKAAEEIDIDTLVENLELLEQVSEKIIDRLS